MPKSLAFIQIKDGVLEITSQIPPGRVTTYPAVGEHLNVMARHVAYILATLTVEEQEVPWYRVVAAKGMITTGKLNNRHLAQIEKLQQEGIKFTAKHQIENFDTLFCQPNQLVNWDNRTKRYLVDSNSDQQADLTH